MAAMGHVHSSGTDRCSPGAPRFPALIGPMLASRGLCLSLLLGVAVLLLAHGTGYAWDCPLHRFTGIPCPGCGMTRAVACALRGEWALGLRHNPFVIAAVLCAALLLASTVVPGTHRTRLAARVSALERKTGLTTIGLGAFVLFGMLRALWSLWRLLP